MLFSPYQQKVVLMFLLGKEWRRSLRWFNRLLISFPNIDTFIISGSISSFSSLPLLSCFLPSFVNMPKNFPSILWGFLELGFYFLHDSRVFFFLFSDANLILILTTISLIGNVILFLPAFFGWLSSSFDFPFRQGAEWGILVASRRLWWFRLLHLPVDSRSSGVSASSPFWRVLIETWKSMAYFGGLWFVKWTYWI